MALQLVGVGAAEALAEGSGRACAVAEAGGVLVDEAAPQRAAAEWTAGGDALLDGGWGELGGDVTGGGERRGDVRTRVGEEGGQGVEELVVAVGAAEEVGEQLVGGRHGEQRVVAVGGYQAEVMGLAQAQVLERAGASGEGLQGEHEAGHEAAGFIEAGRRALAGEQQLCGLGDECELASGAWCGGDVGVWGWRWRGASRRLCREWLRIGDRWRDRLRIGDRGWCWGIGEGWDGGWCSGIGDGQSWRKGQVG